MVDELRNPSPSTLPPRYESNHFNAAWLDKVKKNQNMNTTKFQVCLFHH